MNKHSITFLLVLPFLQVASLNAHAAQPASLVIPEELDIVSVDNVNQSSTIFSGGDATLKLQPGPHKIVVEYDVIFDIGYDDHEPITSEYFQISFSAAAGKQYYIKIPSFNNVEEARAYANKPVVDLIDRSSNQSVAAEITYREFDGTFSKHYTKPLITSKPEPAPVNSAAMVSAPATSTSNTPKSDSEATVDRPLKMLEYWWQQANEQQRKKFIESR